MGGRARKDCGGCEGRASRDGRGRCCDRDGRGSKEETGWRIDSTSPKGLRPYEDSPRRPGDTEGTRCSVRSSGSSLRGFSAGPRPAGIFPDPPALAGPAKNPRNTPRRRRRSSGRELLLPSPCLRGAPRRSPSRLRPSAARPEGPDPPVPRKLILTPRPLPHPEFGSLTPFVVVGDR